MHFAVTDADSRGTQFRAAFNVVYSAIRWRRRQRMTIEEAWKILRTTIGRVNTSQRWKSSADLLTNKRGCRKIRFLYYIIRYSRVVGPLKGPLLNVRRSNRESSMLILTEDYTHEIEFNHSVTYVQGIRIRVYMLCTSCMYVRICFAYVRARVYSYNFFRVEKKKVQETQKPL